VEEKVVVGVVKVTQVDKVDQVVVDQDKHKTLVLVKQHNQLNQVTLAHMVSDTMVVLETLVLVMVEEVVEALAQLVLQVNLQVVNLVMVVMVV
jgi:1,6-anhydro-N-acetylmuramate kinase